LSIIKDYGSQIILFYLQIQKIIEMPEHNPGQMGGTMRLGKRRTIFKTESILSNGLFFLQFKRLFFNLCF
jgi:hypothetical protein